MTQEEFLLHYGVKGMKWGVRKAASGAGRYAKALGTNVALNVTHPVINNRAINANFKSSKTAAQKARKRAIGYSTKEIEGINAKVKSQVAAKKREKKENAKAKQLEKKENEWARTQPDALLKKYAADPTITKEALVKAQKVIGKKKYVSDEEMGKIYTKSVVDAINKRLDAAPDNKSPSGDKRVRVEVVEAFGQTLLKPVVQTKIEKSGNK
jgi:hypothetical protein